MGILEAIESLINNETIYINSFPQDAPDNITTLYHYGGLDPDMVLGSSHTNINYAKIQIRVRDKSYSNAYARLHNIRQTIIGSEYSDGDITILSIQQWQDIFGLGQDDKNRTELVLSFKVLAKYN